VSRGFSATAELFVNQNFDTVVRRAQSMRGP